MEAADSATLTQQFTEDHPATLRVEFQNTANHHRMFEFDRDASLGTAVTAHRDEATSESIGVLTEAHGSAIPDGPTPEGCWQAAQSVGPEDDVGRTELHPDETRTITYTILAPYQSVHCLEPVRYR